MEDVGTIKDTEVNSQISTNAIELDTKTNDEIVQKQLMVRSYPSLKDLMDRKVTWKEFLGVYNVLRIAIAAVCAIIICLFIFAIIWFINPNKCFPERDNPTKIQWNPIKIQIMNWLELTLCFGPVIKLFGYEWKWTAKRTNLSLLLFVFAMFFVFIPHALMYNVGFIQYAAISITILVLVFVIYVFSASGFYVFWMVTPFIIAFGITSGVVVGSSYFFRYVLGPDNAYLFSPGYSVFLNVLQMVLFRFDLYSFPYKWGHRWTCPCHKDKCRTTGDAEHKQVTVESELSDMMLFWWSMLTIAVVETFRIAEYVAYLDDPDGWHGLYQFFAYNIVLEIMSRNGMIWEIIYKILNKEVPARTRMMRIYYGAKLQAEWIPIWCAFLMNIFGYGPFEHCDYVQDIELSAKLNVNGKWWFFGAMFASEIAQALGTELMIRLARSCKWYGMKNDKGEDPPRSITLVKVNLLPMIWILIQCYVFSYEVFILDKNNRIAIHT
eukprot:357102_1